MVHIQKFVFSPFSENTYVVYREKGACWIIDPGCYDREEEQELKSFVDSRSLKPQRLLNTHCHLDHIFGNDFVHHTYGLLPEYHEKDEQTMALDEASAQMYGMHGYKKSPRAGQHLKEGDVLELAGSRWEVLFVPGHAPGHIAFVNHEMKTVIGGDVLFQRSIGRTDLPGGNHDVLLESIGQKLMVLPDDFTVYCGHGPETTIGEERLHNPFF